MRDRTTLIIAHRLSTIRLADRVVLFEGGKVLAEGTHDDLMRRVPSYAEILSRAEEERQAALRAERAPEEAPRQPMAGGLGGVESPGRPFGLPGLDLLGPP
jgi:ABC-type multidrug transport system ATPase subunit